MRVKLQLVMCGADGVKVPHLRRHRVQGPRRRRTLSQAMLGGQAHRGWGRERRFDRPGELTFVARLGADGGWGNFVDVAIKRETLGPIRGPQDLDHFIEVLVRLLDG